MTMFSESLNTRYQFVVNQTAMTLRNNSNYFTKSFNARYKTHLDDMFPIGLLSTMTTSISFQITMIGWWIDAFLIFLVRTSIVAVHFISENYRRAFLYLHISTTPLRIIRTNRENSLEITTLAAINMRAHLFHVHWCIPCELKKFMSGTYTTITVYFIFDRMVLQFRFCQWLRFGFALMTGRFVSRYTLSRWCCKIASSALEAATFVVAMMLHMSFHIPLVNGFEVAKFAHDKIHCVIPSMTLKSITNVMSVIALITIIYFNVFVFVSNVFNHR